MWLTAEAGDILSGVASVSAPVPGLRRGVVVSSTSFGPRAKVEGTRLDAWLLIDALREPGATPANVADHFAVPTEVVFAAMEYAAEFPDRLVAERAAFFAAAKAAGEQLPHVG